MLYHDKFAEQTEHVESLPLEGTANTDYCDCDKIERGCWWYLPVSIGFAVLTAAIGYVVGHI